MWTFVIRRERNGNRNYEMYADGVRINQALGDELFTLPGDVKLLDNKSSNTRPGRKERPLAILPLTPCGPRLCSD